MRAILLSLLITLGLAGCQTLNRTHYAPVPDISSWIETLDDHRRMELEQAEQALKAFNKPVVESFDLYRYGLVNQQLGDRLGWIRARDSFRELAGRSLSPQQLALVNLLLEYNQKMINADARNSRLIQAVSSSDEQIQQLEHNLINQQQEVIKLEQQLEDLKAVEEAISHKRADPLQGITESE